MSMLIVMTYDAESTVTIRPHKKDQGHSKGSGEQYTRRFSGWSNQ